MHNISSVKVSYVDGMNRAFCLCVVCTLIRIFSMCDLTVLVGIGSSDDNRMLTFSDIFFLEYVRALVAELYI